MSIETAKISEIFVSYQGEGPFAGSRQLFVRFYGCNKKCVYCDTNLNTYRSFTKSSLMGSVMEFGEDYNEVSLTGGEPLLYADLISGFLTLFRRYRKTPIFLETNGTLPGELAKVIDKVDIISMDFKLPSSAEDSRDEWAAHEEFYKMSLSKELIVKAVVTGNTKMEDVKKMAEIIVNHGKRPSIVLQPVTVVNDSVRAHDEETLFYFKKYLEKATGGEITVIGQIHKCLGIR